MSATPLAIRQHVRYRAKSWRGVFRPRTAQLGRQASLIYPNGMDARATTGTGDATGQRLASLVALIFLFGTAIALQYTMPFRLGVFSQLTDFGKAIVQDLSPANFLLGGLAFATWLALVVVFRLALFVVPLLVEVLLEGPPKSWRTTMEATAWQGWSTAILATASPFLARILPDTWGLPPLLRVTQANLPDWLAPAAPIALALLSLCILNLAQYWAHRAQHAIPWLWRFHLVHHSVRDMDSMNSFTHPADMIGLQIVTSTLMALVVVDFEMLLWIGGMLSIHDRLLHMRANVNFGVLKNVLIDNRHHFIHHSADPRDFNRNFSFFFTFWDKLFGTYAAPRDITLVTTGLLDHEPPRTLGQFISGRLAPSDAPGTEDWNQPAGPRRRLKARTGVAIDA